MEESYICRTQRKIRDGKAVIELGDACFSKSVVMHEMMHLLGFEHEHQRADRDCYVEFDETKGKKAWVGKKINVFQTLTKKILNLFSV